METINDDVNNVGIEFVKTRERRLAKKEYGVTSFPALGLFRNGHYLGFEGDLTNPIQVIFHNFFILAQLLISRLFRTKLDSFNFKFFY